MGENIAEPEAMEESGSAKKIDLSLDDIIKLNKKEQKAIPGGYRRKSNKFDQVREQQQGFPFRRGGYHGQQGPNRFRYAGPVMRGSYRSRPYLRGRGMRGGKGISPLNRAQFNTKNPEPFGQTRTQFRRPFFNPYRGRARPWRSLPPGPHIQHSQAGPRGQKRPFVLNRGFFARGAGGPQQTYQRARGWRRAPSSRSVLTVSLPNAPADSQPGAILPPAGDRALEEGSASTPHPKGVPLRFNFKAVSNQTALSLNDRFTSLRIRGGTGQRPWRGRGRGRGSRMVTLQ